ncbi:hypothetical protein [Sorangium sp. So ce1097]|uniref:hypothetical protein n=1 Tax=Sorangium sp. So ce1097 TaxID=3133330 RepID=UPI003F6236CA
METLQDVDQDTSLSEFSQVRAVLFFWIGASSSANGHGIIDIRDRAEWLASVVERRATGIFNAAAPGEPLTMGWLLDPGRDTLSWWKKTPPPERRSRLRAGLSPEREAELLTTWRARRAQPRKAGALPP